MQEHHLQNERSHGWCLRPRKRLHWVRKVQVKSSQYSRTYEWLLFFLLWGRSKRIPFVSYELRVGVFIYDTRKRDFSKFRLLAYILADILIHREMGSSELHRLKWLRKFRYFFNLLRTTCAPFWVKIPWLRTAAIHHWLVKQKVEVFYHVVLCIEYWVLLKNLKTCNLT